MDLNVPGAKSTESLQELCSCLQFLNDLAPTRTVGLVELPEIPKKSSKRGLCDEENELQTVLWSLRQSCDSRWMCPFNIHQSADAHSNRRQVSVSGVKLSKDQLETKIRQSVRNYMV